MSLATMHTLADEIIQKIAIFAASSSLGPPSEIIPLIATCRSFYRCLNFDGNPHLYAQIFRAQFDTSALSRRFYIGQLSAHSLANELKRRWLSLRRIRFASQAGGELWTDRRRGPYRQSLLKLDLTIAYLMFLESDGMNALQLIRWARLDDYLERFQTHVLLPFHLAPQMPPGSTETALYVWLTWFCMDFHRALSRNTDKLPWLMIAYTFGSFSYPGSYAPWSYHHLPLSSPSPYLTQDVSRTPVNAIFNVDNSLHARSTFTALTSYFGLPISLSTPLLSQGATMCWLLVQSREPLFALNHPASSRDALLAAMRAAGSFTSASDIAFEDSPSFAPSSYTPTYMQTRFASITDSRIYDDEWKRLIFCRDPHLYLSHPGRLSLPLYSFTKGSLTGEWDGRSVGTQVDTYHRIMNGEPAINVLEDDPFLLHDMHSWHVQEHYFRKRRSPSQWPNNAPVGLPLPTGPPLNAHLPMFTSHMEAFVAWERGRWVKGITVRTLEQSSFYETWDPANPIEDESDEDEVDDDLIHVIITGNSIARSPDIPGTHNWMYKPGSFMYGTIRRWDGLITLKVNPVEAWNGQWIWSGYLVGSGPGANWVGRYRRADVDVDQDAYGGVFTMVKRLP